MQDEKTRKGRIITRIGEVIIKNVTVISRVMKNSVIYSECCYAKLTGKAGSMAGKAKSVIGKAGS
jgi:hypothetical protein